MRVLMVSKACYVAAYRRKLEEMARHEDVDLTLVVPESWGTGPAAARLEAGFDQGYRTIVSQPALSGRHHEHFYPALGRIVRDLRPDIVHIDEEPYDWVTVHALLAARGSGAKTLFFTWQNLDRRFPPPYAWFERFTLGRVDAAIAGNEEAAVILRRRGFKRPLVVLPQFGIDPALFSPPAERPRPPAILAAARLVPEKGLATLLQALAGLAGDWACQLAGDGPQRSELTALADKLGIADRVTFLGALPSTQMPEIIRRASILALPSLTTPKWKEQFGRVLVEAMACEVAVVGSDSGEIPHVIGDAGLVVPEGDTVALRSALAVLTGQPAVRQYFGVKGRARALDRFTQRRIADETIALYRRVLG